MYVYHSFNEKICVYYINLEVTHACYTLLLTLSALLGHFASLTSTCEINTCNNNNNNHHHHRHHHMNIQACFRHISNMGSFQKIIPQKAHFPSNRVQIEDQNMHRLRGKQFTHQGRRTSIHQTQDVKSPQILEPRNKTHKILYLTFFLQPNMQGHSKHASTRNTRILGGISQGSQCRLYTRNNTCHKEVGLCAQTTNIILGPTVSTFELVYFVTSRKETSNRNHFDNLYLLVHLFFETETSK